MDSSDACRSLLTSSIPMSWCLLLVVWIIWWAVAAHQVFRMFRDNCVAHTKFYCIVIDKCYILDIFDADLLRRVKILHCSVINGTPYSDVILSFRYCMGLNACACVPRHHIASSSLQLLFCVFNCAFWLMHFTQTILTRTSSRLYY